MGLKKYEIITVGSDKRVRALRSWQVQDRYVNIGDVGGIVYDEKTLSQDGACWLFRGNFNFPGARIGGDSIVDVGEATLSAAGAPTVDILGSSVVVGSKLIFESEPTVADAVVLTAADFEQGTLNFVSGANWETMKSVSNNFVRTKAPIFSGGAPVTVKCAVEGYAVQAYVLDRDGNGITATASTNTGVGVTLAIPAGQYFMLRLVKNPFAATVPADATAARITFTGTYETKLSIVDSRVEINPATSTGASAIKPGGTYTITSGAKYPEAIIRNSKVSINILASTGGTFRITGQIIGSTATLDGTTGSVAVAGLYANVKNLVFSGAVTGGAGVSSYGAIQATDCDNFAVSATIFPGLEAALSANMPFIFQGCNVPDGRFYHHAQIANTYRDINFDLATRDLGKTFSTDRILGSSEVNGMYRVTLNGTPGPLVESYESVKSMVVNQNQNMYDTTIYADAYFNGFFDIRGTNVFGNTMKHEASNTQNVMAVQGGFTLTAGSPPVPNSSPNVVSTINPIRINGGNGFTVTLPTGIQARLIFIDARGIYVTASGWLNNVVTVPAANLTAYAAFITFQKTGGTAITPDDVKGVTITTYNGCKLVNTKATAATIAGNVRVEENATLIDTSVTGTGYFGGNSIAQAPSALVGQLPIKGAAYMSDNAVFAPSAANASAGISLLEMSDNATFSGQLAGASTNYNITMADNAQFLGTHGSRNGFIMRGNSFVAAAGTVAAAPECSGLLTMKDDARIEAGTVTTVGDITLCGKYKQTANKVWTGKRVIDDQNAPAYDNNVKTKYDI